LQNISEQWPSADYPAVDLMAPAEVRQAGKAKQEQLTCIMICLISVDPIFITQKSLIRNEQSTSFFVFTSNE